MNLEELRFMQKGICDEVGAKFFGSYTEEQVALFLGHDPSTIKRWRKAGKIFPMKEPGGKGIRYMGWQIADMIMGRPQPWDATLQENSNSATTGSTSETAPQLGTGAGAKVDAQSALRLARQTLKKQSNG